MQPIRCEGFDSYSLRTLGVIMLSRLRLGHVRLFATAPRGPETRLCIRCEGISLRESHVAMDNPIINQGFHSENHGESWKIRENHPKSWKIMKHLPKSSKIMEKIIPNHPEWWMFNCQVGVQFLAIPARRPGDLQKTGGGRSSKARDPSSFLREIAVFFWHLEFQVIEDHEYIDTR